jgi:hypothetical protein
MSKFLMELEHIETATLPELLEIVTKVVTEAWGKAQANLTTPQPTAMFVIDGGEVHPLPPPETPSGGCGCPHCTLRRMNMPIDMERAN